MKGTTYAPFVEQLNRAHVESIIVSLRGKSAARYKGIRSWLPSALALAVIEVGLDAGWDSSGEKFHATLESAMRLAAKKALVTVDTDVTQTILESFDCELWRASAASTLSHKTDGSLDLPFVYDLYLKIPFSVKLGSRLTHADELTIPLF